MGAHMSMGSPPLNDGRDEIQTTRGGMGGGEGRGGIYIWAPICIILFYNL